MNLFIPITLGFGAIIGTNIIFSMIKEESVMAGRKKVALLPGSRRDVVLQHQSQNKPLGPVINTQSSKVHSLPRPKRNIQVKNLDDSSGLSWREERELKRALYASLQESRKQNRQQQQEQQSENQQQNSTSPSGTNKTTPTTTTNHHSATATTRSTPTPTPIITPKTNTANNNNTTTTNIATHSRNNHHINNYNHLNHRTNHCHKNPHRKTNTNSGGHVPTLGTNSSFNHLSSLSSSSNQSTCSNNSSASSAKNSVVDENSRDSMKPVLGVGAHIRSANIATTDIKRTKIHAQRKFAQGSLPSTPNTTPNKAKMSPLCLPKRAKTEDFLTFLCLRGSSVLPSHLDFFNYTSKDSASGGENSRPHTPASNCKQQHNSSSSRAQTRESSPLSTATSTSSNDDVADVLPSFHISAYTNGVGLSKPKAVKALKLTDSKSGDVPSVNSPGVKKSKAVRCLQTPNRQAARACASTPETARGLAAMQQQNLVKKVAGKLGAKLGLTNSSRLRSTLNSSPNKKTVKAKIPQPKSSARNGMTANDLRNKKRSPGRPPLKRKLKERGTRVKNAPVHVIPETKKRTVVVRSGKPGVLRTLTKSQNSNYTTSAQSQKSFSKTNSHGKPVRNATLNSHRNHTNSVLPVVPLRKLSENLPNRQKVPQRGKNKLPVRPIRKLQKKSWKQTDGQMSPAQEQFSKKRSRHENTTASTNRLQKTRPGVQSRSDDEPRIQPSRFSKRLSLQLAQRAAAAMQEEVENKVKPPAPKKAKLSEPLIAAPVSTAPALQPVSSTTTTTPSLPHLFSSAPTPSSAAVVTTQASPHTVNSNVCQNGLHHHHHHHHHFLHVHQRQQQQQQHYHHHHHHQHSPASHVHHQQQHQQQYHLQQQVKQKPQQAVNKQQLVTKQQSVKQQQSTKLQKQNKQTNKQGPKQQQLQQQQQSTPKPQKQQQSTLKPQKQQPPTPTTKQQIKQQQEQVQTNNMPPATVDTSDVSSKKKSNSLKMLRMPTREQLKLAHIIEKRRGKKNSTSSPSPPSATADTPNNLPQVVNDSAKPKENVPTTERRRGRPPIPKKSPQSSVDCAPKAKPFPEDGEPACIVDIPVFYPSEEQFQDPLAYIESIKKEAEPYGMCKIVPPSNWKHESRINEEMRFTSQVQYINRMFNHWGPNVQHVECIQKHLASVGIELVQPPLIGGIELDLSRLHQSIKEQGGMQTVMDKKKWSKVADMVKIPKQAQDRTTKLYNAYCKYLLSYEMLPEDEKAKLLQQVTEERNQRLQQRQNKVCHQLNEDDGHNRCIAKGKSTSLNAFQRVARNIQSMWFREDPSPEQVESEYWKIVQEASSHVAVQCGHINSGNQSTFLPNKKESPSTKHGWNFNMLSQNPLSVLRHLGPVPGVTLPILHIGMLFTTSCWSVNRHNLPYVHYLHSGADLIWYSIPKQLKQKLKSAMKELVPGRIGNGEAWLKEDAIMVNPELLVEKSVSVGRIVQKQHQFVVVFPYTYTSSLTCGYSVSECLPYATPDWLPLGQAIAQVLRRNCLWPEMFSLDSLLRRIVKAEPAVSDELLTQALPFLEKAIEHELSLRKQLYDAGLKNAKKMNANEPLVPSSPKRKRLNDGEEENRCEVYKRICYFSMVVNEVDDSLYCLDHALAHIQKKRNLKACKLYYRYSDEDLQELLKNASSRLNSKESGTAITDPSSKRKSTKVNETARLKKLNVD